MKFLKNKLILTADLAIWSQRNELTQNSTKNDSDPYSPRFHVTFNVFVFVCVCVFAERRDGKCGPSIPVRPKVRLGERGLLM